MRFKDLFDSEGRRRAGLQWGQIKYRGRELLREMVHPVNGAGGAGGGFNLLHLLPGADVNYAREVGDPWRNSAAFIGLTFLARNAAMARPKITRDDGNPATVDEVRGHDLVRLLRRPNRYHTLSDLLRFTVLQLSTGNAYWLKIPSRGGGVAEVYPLPNHMIEPWSDGPKQLVSKYLYKPGSELIELDPDQVIHFKTGIDPDNPMKGLSDLGYLARELHTDNSVGTMHAAIAANFGVPGLIVTPGDENGQIHPNDVPAITRGLNEKTTGSNRGKTIVVTGPLKVDKLAFSPKEMDVAGLRDAPAERILAALGLNAMAVGLPSDSKTYSNYGESNKAAWYQGVIPLLGTLSGAIDHQLLPDVGSAGERFEFDVSHVPGLAESEDAKYERIGQAYLRGTITRAEARQSLGFPTDRADEAYLHELLPPPPPVVRSLPPAAGRRPLPKTIVVEALPPPEPKAVEPGPIPPAAPAPIEVLPAPPGDTLVIDGGAAKALGGGKFGGYTVLFSDEDNPDLVGDFFTRETDFRLGETRPILLYHHGQDPEIGTRTLGTVALKADDAGIWAEGRIDLTDRYGQAIYRLVKEGELGFSSGSAGHLVTKLNGPKAKRILEWPLFEVSFTPAPCEPRTAAIPLKSLPPAPAIVA